MGCKLPSSIFVELRYRAGCVVGGLAGGMREVFKAHEWG